MSILNSSKKEINFKIVYYGPPLSGKTTSLQQLQKQIGAKKKTPVKSGPETERTLFFDFLPLTSKDIKGYTPRFQIYTVPGQDLYENSRRILLKGVDGLIFVADSQLDKLQDNLKSLEEMSGILKTMEHNPNDIPTIIQYNKRDLSNAASLDELRKVLNTRHVPDFETSALKGEGILPAFQACLREVISALRFV